MNTTTSVVATGVIVLTGRWSDDKKLDVKVMVGGAVFAFALAVIGQTNQKLAEQFGALILVSAAFLYIPTIASKLGWTNINPPTWGSIRDN